MSDRCKYNAKIKRAGEWASAPRLVGESRGLRRKILLLWTLGLETMEVKQSSDILDTPRKTKGFGESQGKDTEGKEPGSDSLICLPSAWHQVKASFHQVNRSPIWLN